MTSMTGGTQDTRSSLIGACHPPGVHHDTDCHPPDGSRDTVVAAQCQGLQDHRSRVHGRRRRGARNQPPSALRVQVRQTRRSHQSAFKTGVRCCSDSSSAANVSDCRETIEPCSQTARQERNPARQRSAAWLPCRLQRHVLRAFRLDAAALWAACAAPLPRSFRWCRRTQETNFCAMQAGNVRLPQHPGGGQV